MYLIIYIIIYIYNYIHNTYPLRFRQSANVRLLDDIRTSHSTLHSPRYRPQGPPTRPLAEYLASSFWAFYFVLDVFLVSFGTLSFGSQQSHESHRWRCAGQWRFILCVWCCRVMAVIVQQGTFTNKKSMILESGCTMFYIFMTSQD